MNYSQSVTGRDNICGERLTYCQCYTNSFQRWDISNLPPKNYRMQFDKKIKIIPIWWADSDSLKCFRTNSSNTRAERTGIHMISWLNYDLNHRKLIINCFDEPFIISSFSHVKTCCFPLTYVIVHWMALGFGLLGQTKLYFYGYFYSPNKNNWQIYWCSCSPAKYWSSLSGSNKENSTAYKAVFQTFQGEIPPLCNHVSTAWSAKNSTKNFAYTEWNVDINSTFTALTGIKVSAYHPTVCIR